MLAVENIGEFSKLIFDSPKFPLPMFYKSINLISHDPVDLTDGFFDTGAGSTSILSGIVKCLGLVGSS